MEFNIRADKRVLYKYGNSGWLVGTVYKTRNAEVNEQGIWIPIVPIGIDPEEEIHWAEIHNIFTDGAELESWMHDYLIPKEEYIKITQEDEFERNLERAWVSDGEYYYYQVAKFNEGWIRKQPFEYILRG